ncbi:MAG: PilX N-terminal domain-containing pilus assembly protein, partial [Candidatus Aminicenantales bacterium]
MDKPLYDETQRPGLERGSGLIVVILVMAFLVSVGVALITVTGIGSRVTGNVRAQQQAFNAAEAGFDAAWIAIEDAFLNETWTSFDGHYLTEPAGI